VRVPHNINNITRTLAGAVMGGWPDPFSPDLPAMPPCSLWISPAGDEFDHTVRALQSSEISAVRKPLEIDRLAPVSGDGSDAAGKGFVAPCRILDIGFWSCIGQEALASLRYRISRLMQRHKALPKGVY
jgi:hypothetical protein